MMGVGGVRGTGATSTSNYQYGRRDARQQAPWNPKEFTLSVRRCDLMPPYTPVTPLQPGRAREIWAGGAAGGRS